MAFTKHNGLKVTDIKRDLKRAGMRLGIIASAFDSDSERTAALTEEVYQSITPNSSRRGASAFSINPVKKQPQEALVVPQPEFSRAAMIPPAPVPADIPAVVVHEPVAVDTSVATTQVAAITQPSNEELILTFLVEVLEPLEPEIAKRQELASLVIIESEKAKFDPLHVAAIITALPAFTKADTDMPLGVMQISGKKGEFLAQLGGVKWKGAGALLNSDYNLELGLSYLKFLESIFKGDKKSALMAYHLGARRFINTVKSGATLPVDVVNFARTVEDRYQNWVSLTE